MEATFLESEEYKQQMSIHFQNHIIREDLKMYNFLVEKCFSHCVEKFRRKRLDVQEEGCVVRCAEKYLKHAMRVGMRIVELEEAAPPPTTCEGVVMQGGKLAVFHYDAIVSGFQFIKSRADSLLSSHLGTRALGAVYRCIPIP